MTRKKKTTKKSQKSAGQRLPALRVHKQSQRCYGTFSGETVWFGKRDDPTTQAKFDAHLAAWLARGRKPAEPRDDGISVKSVVARHLRHLEEKHTDWDSKNFERISQALKPLLKIHGADRAADFSPLKLKAVRHAMIANNRLCRGEVNTRVQTIRRCFKWAVSEELVPAAVFHGLQSVEHLRPGEYGVREGRTREPVEESVVLATLLYLHPVAAALVELLWHTGGRPSEILNLCPADIDRSGDVWIAQLRHHKTAKKGKHREIDFGPQSQQVLRRYLDRVPTPRPDEPIFSPKMAMAEYNHLRRVERQTPLWEAHRQRYEREGGRRKSAEFSDRYTATALRRAIARAIARANRDREESNADGADPDLPLLPRWTPYQLRHAALTRIRSARGIEAAKAVGGHSTIVMTEGYSMRAERELARRIAAEMG